MGNSRSRSGKGIEFVINVVRLSMYYVMGWAGLGGAGGRSGRAGGRGGVGGGLDLLLGV